VSERGRASERLEAKTHFGKKHPSGSSNTICLAFRFLETRPFIVWRGTTLSWADSAMDPPPSDDAAVRATNDEAFMAKLSAVSRGYLRDPYIIALSDALASSPLPFSDSAMTRPSPLRQPMINRGTFARVCFVRRMVTSFLAAAPAGSVPQVVSFGAGHDTLSFVLFADEPDRRLHYVELDFPEVVQSKANAVAATPGLASLFDRMTRLGNGGDRGFVAHTASGSQLDVRACDLRDVSGVKDLLIDAGLDLAAPTVFLAECVLVYMDPLASDALIQFAAVDFTGLRAFVAYEPIEPHDAFGVQMVNNIGLRGSPLLGINQYPSVEAQEKRFRDIGWSQVNSMTMLDAFSSLLDADEVKRINRIEMLDEVEEWQLMMQHYCFCWARTAPGGSDDLLNRLALKFRA
jgi:tRNA wybutosine-synthesizing protein 4